MKIKNMKLMLLGLFGLMSASNASAAPAKGDVITRANLAFEVTDVATTTANAKVKFLGMVATPAETDADGAIANQPDGTLTIPSSTWTLDGDGNKIILDVTAIDAGWSTTYGCAAKLKTKLKKLVVQVAEKDKDGKAITNLAAANFAVLEEVQLPTGQVELKAEAFRNCPKLATINLANIEKFGDRCLNNTAITAIDLTKAKTIGTGAFGNVFTVSTVTIPSTVESIGDKAFALMTGTITVDGKPVQVGLENVTFNANDKITTFNATLFTGSDRIKNIKIVSSKFTTIPANAFVSTIVETIDLTGCTALTTIDANAFAASTKLTSVKLTGTKVTDLANLDVSSSNRTLAEFTFPATLTNAGLPANYFENNIALTEIDLSGTAVTQIPDELFAWAPVAATEKLDDKGASYSPKQFISPALATVTLNAETTSIGTSAFDGCAALATVTGLNQDKLKTINPFAFNGTGMTALDLSAATNAAFVTIPKQAFGNMANLATITLPAQITGIAQGAFLYDAAVTSINLEDLTELKTLNDLFHAGVAAPGDINDVAIALATVTLPEALTKIADGALQLLDIEEITIPATVANFGASVLQGCINLKKFKWEDSQVPTLPGTTFIGDDRLEEVRFMTLNENTTLGSTKNDDIFKGNNKDVLKVYVNAEAYVKLRAAGWSEANLKYCTLVGEGESELEITAKSGEYYYRTFKNKENATWFKAEEVEVFTAVVEGSKVVLKAASTEGGYYKVAKYAAATPIDANGEQQKNAVCIIRSTNQKVTCELKAATYNDLSTLSEDNALQVAIKDFTPSRLKYQYKFGLKDGKLAFWRVTSGTIKKDGIFIDSAVKKDRLDIVFEGDATAIQSFKAEVENNAPIYNLNGVRVNKAQKGVYIQDGKKYMMK